MKALFQPLAILLWSILLTLVLSNPTEPLKRYIIVQTGEVDNVHLADAYLRANLDPRYVRDTEEYSPRQAWNIKATEDQVEHIRGSRIMVSETGGRKDAAASAHPATRGLQADLT